MLTIAIESLYNAIIWLSAPEPGLTDVSLGDEFKECFEELCSEDEAYGFKRGFFGKEP